MSPGAVTCPTWCSMLATGVRIGEALGALWSEIDFDAAPSRSPAP